MEISLLSLNFIVKLFCYDSRSAFAFRRVAGSLGMTSKGPRDEVKAARVCSFSAKAHLHSKRRWLSACIICSISLLSTYMTMAEFFIILPQGPNCWMGLGAFSDRVRLLPVKNHQRKRKRKETKKKQVSQLCFFVSAICTLRFTLSFRFHAPLGLRNNTEPQLTHT